MAYTNDIDIARSANLLPIEKVGSKIGVYADDVNLYGKNNMQSETSLQSLFEWEFSSGDMFNTPASLFSHDKFRIAITMRVQVRFDCEQLRETKY